MSHPPSRSEARSQRLFFLLGESWISQVFLFGATVLLPILLVAGAALSAVEDDFRNREQAAQARLSDEAEHFSKILNPQEIMLRFFWNLWVQDRRAVDQELQDLERRAPGAFRWVAWDTGGNILDLPPEVALPGKNTWREIIDRFLRTPRTIKSALQETDLSADPTWLKLQTLLGPQLPVETFLNFPVTLHRTTRMGNPCLLLWRTFLDPAEVPRDRKARFPSIWGRQLGGVLVFCFPDKLPRGFWDTLVYEKKYGRDLVSSAYLGLLPLQRPERFLLDLSGKKLPHPGFGRALYRAISRMTGSTCRVGRFLVAPVIGEARDSMRFTLLRDLTPLHRQAERRRGWVVRLAGFGVLVGAALFLSLRGGVATNLSLVWKISGLFVVAIFLPLLGLLQSGLNQIVNLEKNGRAELQARFRECSGRLRFLQGEFPDLYGVALHLRLRRMLKQEGSIPRLIERLRGEVEDGWFANVFVSKNNGEMDVTLGQPPQPKVLSAIRMMIRKAFSEAFPSDRPETSAPLAGMLTEAFQDVLENPEALDLNQGLGLRSFRFFRSEFYGMVFNIRMGSDTRLLFLTLSPTQVQRAFAQREFRRNRFALSPPPGDWKRPQLAFLTMMQNQPNYPEASPYTTRQELLSGGTDVEGITTQGGETFAHFSPAASPGTAYRTVFWCALTPLHDRIRERKKQLVGEGLLIVLVALLLGLQLAARLLAPIWQLEDKVTAVGEGNLQVAMPAGGQDELGRLAGSFNEMIRGLRERERMQAYVSENVLEAVRDGAGSQARRGISRMATILFCDVRNFTTLSEKHGPEAMFRMLNDFLGAVDHPIREHGGRIDKFIGDAVMAVFLADGTDQAWGAVRAAMAMKEYLAVFNRRRETEGLFTIDIGIGINTGMVMLGDVGSDRRKDLTVIGDAVNLAARLETASKQGRHTRIVLSEDTWQQVKEQVEAEEMAITEVKGKHQSIRMFELISLRAAV